MLGTKEIKYEKKKKASSKRGIKNKNAPIIIAVIKLWQIYEH